MRFVGIRMAYGAIVEMGEFRYVMISTTSLFCFDLASALSSSRKASSFCGGVLYLVTRIIMSLMTIFKMAPEIFNLYASFIKLK